MKMRRLTNWFKRLFGIGTPPAPPKVEQPPIEIAPPLPEPAPPVIPVGPGVDLTETRAQQLTRWTKAALDVVQSFEGTTPYANITGDFDNMGLTCGALGWTWYYGDQQRLVKEFVRKNSLGQLLAAMPTFGKRYWDLCNMTRAASINVVSALSNSKGVVFQPYKKELETFWQHPEMVKIQIAEAERNMVNFALSNIGSFGGAKTFQKFLWLFDTRVLNGSLKGLDLSRHKNAALEIIMQQYVSNIDEHGGYNAKDAKKNEVLWSKRSEYQDDEAQLMALGYLRAEDARSEFFCTVMNRRGTISTEVGWVNGSLRFPFEECGIDPREELKEA